MSAVFILLYVGTLLVLVSIPIILGVFLRALVFKRTGVIYCGVTGGLICTTIIAIHISRLTNQVVVDEAAHVILYTSAAGSIFIFFVVTQWLASIGARHVDRVRESRASSRDRALADGPSGSKIGRCPMSLSSPAPFPPSLGTPRSVVFQSLENGVSGVSISM